MKKVANVARFKRCEKIAKLETESLWNWKFN